MPTDIIENWFVIRADANANIGIGHAMRCLALAEWLVDKKIKPVLITKHRNDFIASKLKVLGGKIVVLDESLADPDNKYNHSAWLKGTEEEDAKSCSQAIIQLARTNYDQKPLFIMVDHYSIGAPWEIELNKVAPILVVDDLSDRAHDCSWLIDQTYGKTDKDYRQLVKPSTKLFIGPEYSLLRKEFSQSAKELMRVFKQKMSVLISLGGVDKNNDTSKILSFLTLYKFFEELYVTIVTGSENPNLDELSSICQTMPNVNLRVDVDNMAHLMKTHDICIGAAGSTSWERCAMAMPTLSLILAENQKTIAQNMASVGAIVDLGLAENLNATVFLEHFEQVCTNESLFYSLSSSGYSLCDGLGCQRIIKEVIN